MDRSRLNHNVSIVLPNESQHQNSTVNAESEMEVQTSTTVSNVLPILELDYPDKVDLSQLEILAESSEDES